MTGNVALFNGIPAQRTSTGGEFDAPRTGGAHRGRDSIAKVGTPVYAAGRGRASAVWRDVEHATYGYRVEVTYLVGDRTFVVGTGHLSRVDVTVGTEVALTTQLGLSGGARGAKGSGVSLAPHLHEDVRVNGVLMNPDLILNDRESAAGGGSTPIPNDWLDMATADEVRAIVADELAKQTGQLKEVARKTTRGQLTFDAGPTGFEITDPMTATRACVYNEQTGFYFELAAPASRLGQIGLKDPAEKRGALRTTPGYTMIDPNADFYGLSTSRYDDLLRRLQKLNPTALIGAKLADGSTLPPLTVTTSPSSIDLSPVLTELETAKSEILAEISRVAAALDMAPAAFVAELKAAL